MAQGVVVFELNPEREVFGQLLQQEQRVEKFVCTALSRSRKCLLVKTSLFTTHAS